MLPTWKQIKRYFIADLTTTRDPFSLAQWHDPVADDPHLDVDANQRLPSAYEGDLKGVKLSPDLRLNVEFLRRLFQLPRSEGLLLHEITLPVTPPRQAVVAYIAGITDAHELSRGVLEPLLDPVRAARVSPTARDLFRRVVEEGQGSLRKEWGAAVNDMLDGSAILLIDGEAECATIRMEGWAKRQVDRPQMEVTVRGPQEALTEDVRTNISLIRKRLRSADLVVEIARVGKLSKTDTAVLYIRGVTNQALVAEVRRRLKGISLDYVTDVGTLGQLIEETPYSIYPLFLNTERPDRVAAQLADGYVAILIDNDAHALIVPVTMPTLLHTAEDYYLRWPSGTFMRLTRVFAFYVALMMPALYVALINYRQEMIPTPLLLAISHSRETVPFSAVVEIVLMESAFELIHEAALRVPTVIGPTIGIVGSLILGQAAVQAGIVSPLLVIITSVTALASFAIPTYELQMSVRMWRFAYLASACIFGLIGLVAFHTLNQVYMCSLRSFGVPFLAPLAPPQNSKDSLFRYATHGDIKRPWFLRPQRMRQGARNSRPWSPRPVSQEDQPDENG